MIDGQTCQTAGVTDIRNFYCQCREHPKRIETLRHSRKFRFAVEKSAICCDASPARRSIAIATSLNSGRPLGPV